MRQVIVLALTLVTIALAGPSLAEPTENIIGVFFDPEGYTDCSMPMAYNTVSAYLIAKDITEESGISGWECSWVTDPADFPGGVTISLENGGINALTAPDFDVTLPEAVPRAPVIVLATWTTYYFGGVIKFGVGPAHPGHFGDDPGPGYVAGNDPEKRMRLHLRCAWGEAPQPDTYYAAVAGMGCPLTYDMSPCGVPVEASSWGAIKEMYR